MEEALASIQEISGVKSSQKGMQSLPPEIKLLVFSYLTLQEICKSVAPVCKCWYDLSKDPSLWIHLSVKLSMWDRTVQIESRCNFLKTLLIDGINKASIYNTPKVFESLFPLPQLKILKMRFITFWSPFLENLASSSPLLESLTLYYCRNLEIGDIGSLARGLALLRNLKHLEVNAIFFILRNDDVDAIVEACPNLQTLILESASVSNQNLQNVALYLKDKLRVLSIQVTSVTAEGYAFLASCVHLQAISLRFAVNLDNSVLDALVRLPLKELSIFFTTNNPDVETVMAMSTESLVRFFSSPERGLLRKVLFDGFPCFDDSVILSIANNCHQLVELAFPRCVNVTDDGLLNLLRRNQRIERLNIEETKITQDIIEPFGIEVLTYPEHIP